MPPLSDFSKGPIPYPEGGKPFQGTDRLPGPVVECCWKSGSGVVSGVQTFLPESIEKNVISGTETGTGR